MRFIYTLSLLLFTTLLAEAQIHLNEVPLERNQVLQRATALEQEVQQEKLVRLFGENTDADRTTVVDCDDDGIYVDGETVYVVSGETFNLCLDTTGFITFNDLSAAADFGNITTEENCAFYEANAGIEVGVGDTIKIELCLPDNAGCSVRSFPVVVRRSNDTIIEATSILTPEMDLKLCAETATFNLPDQITSTSILDCHNLTLASVLNYNTKDSCIFIKAERFAGLDTICLEISNDFCVSDLHKFPFQVIGDTMNLPFLDDFSYDGPYPGDHWLDRDAFVNNTWGYQPPSIGFATMDGLDRNGKPRGNGYGRSDFLTSNYLDLSPFNSGSNVYFSCFAQTKGYGYHPSESDSLIVEFKKSNGAWVQIHAFQGIDGSVPKDSLPPFDNFFSFSIISSDYLYDGFQFRFVNYAQRVGIRDVWHVDYVKVTANEVPDGTFEDIAFTYPPNDILKRYSSIPFRHFDNSMLIDSIDIELYSQFGVTETANPSGLKLRELETGTDLLNLSVLLLTDAIAPENQRNVPPQVHKLHTNPVDLGNLPAFTEDRLVFELEYFMDVNAENPGVFPEVERNNTVKSQTIFDNYFAYDDGSPETAMEIGFQTGEGVAARYTAAEADTLRAIQINFPHYNTQTNARFNLKVHIGTLGNVVHEQDNLTPFFPDSVVDTLQGYTTFRLTDNADNLAPVAIPAGDFYVELEQATNVQNTLVGLDKNTLEAREYQFFKIQGMWVPLANRGAIMMRPVVGSFTPGSTPVQEIIEDQLKVKVFPNPTTGIVHFDLNGKELQDYEVRVFNAIGQQLIFKTLSDTEIDLSNYGNGIYYLQIKNTRTNQIENHKIIKAGLR